MSRRDGCDFCTVWRNERGYHHAAGCPEMFWPDGWPRGELRPGTVKPPGPLRTVNRPSRSRPTEGET